MNNKISYTPEQIIAIKEMANLNIVKVLNELEMYDDMKDKYPKYIHGKCPIHKGDNKTGFSWDYEKGIFKCWTRGCHNAGNDVYGLVEQLLGLPFTGAIEWVIETLNIDLYNLTISKDKIENMNFIRSYRRKLTKDDDIINDGVLSKLKDASEYVAKDRGFRQEIIKLFNPRFGFVFETTEGSDARVAFPVKNIQGEIVGFTGRRINDDLKIPKWFHSSGFEKMNHLYNMDRAKKHIQETGIIVLVEGPYDVMAFENAGIKNVVAVLGVELSDKQREIIWSSGAFTAITAMDEGEAGNEATRKITEELKKYLSVKKFQISNGREDVGEMMREELQDEYRRVRS